MSERYEGRPLLRLIECYVLDCIDQLDPRDRDHLVSMTPKLRSSLGSDAETWRGILEDVLDLPSEYPEAVRRDWDTKRNTTRRWRKAATPEEYAAEIADTFSIR